MRIWGVPLIKQKGPRCGGRSGFVTQAFAGLEKSPFFAGLEVGCKSQPPGKPSEPQTPR